MVLMHELVIYINELLDIELFKDYCPNGLQVEGRPEVHTLISGVTASQALLQAAIATGADAILVHHGYFWKSENPCITGIKRRRLGALLASDISLLAYHLPLDAHPVYGNNAQLGKLLGVNVQGHFGLEQGPAIGLHGSLTTAMAVADFKQHLEHTLNRVPLHESGATSQIRTLAWCTGAAQSYIEQAVDLGVDAFITGEVSEQTVHVARETGLHFFACGHHATERYGVRALGEHLARKFDLTHQFIDIDNPV